MDRRSLLVSGALLAAATAAGAAAGTGPATFSIDGHVVLQAYQALVEEHLTGVLRAIRALAATSDAQTGSWTSIRPALDRLSQDLTTDATVWFAMPDGGYATTAAGPVGETLADRDYFPRLMAGRDVAGALVISKSTGHRSIIVATPVTKAGAIIAAIGVSLRADLVSQLVGERIKLPDDMSFYALDSKGQTAIHQDPERMFQYPSEVGDASLKSAVATMLSQPRGRVEYRFAGTSRTALFNESDVTGWRFVLVRIRK
jgi:methyl-accepting chemotaxis protein